MIYKIIFSKKVLKELSSLPVKDGKKVVSTIEDLVQDPKPVGSKKLKGSENKYRVRVGDYRIIYSIDDNILTIEIIRIGHRRDVYE